LVVLLLAFDTSTPAVTVAIHDGSSLLAERTVVDARRHGELLAPAIAGALADAGCAVTDLTQLAVGVGPGPFTGLRVGVVTALAMADALGVRLDGVCSLDVLAADVARNGSPEPFLVATDARRHEVYFAVYDGAARRTAGPEVAKAADIGWSGAAYGAGALLYKDVFGSAAGPELPSAATLAALVATGRAELLAPVPLYLRRPDAVEPGARKAALQGNEASSVAT
jgi:tRNA threonylcarbamoyladenosine biosynthesis protein TsaB